MGLDVDLFRRLAGPVGQDRKPGGPIVRSAGFGSLEARQVMGGARAVQVVRVVGGDHGDTAVEVSPPEAGRDPARE